MPNAVRASRNHWTTEGHFPFVIRTAHCPSDKPEFVSRNVVFRVAPHHTVSFVYRRHSFLVRDKIRYGLN